MTDTVLAWIDAERAGQLRWRDGSAQWQLGDYAQFAAVLGARDCVLLVDGSNVTLLTVALPVSDLRTARQAAPFAIEERLAQPIEEMQLALAPLGAGHFAVAATARGVLDAIAAALAASPLTPTLVTPEFCSVPCAPQAWTISIEDEHALVRIDTTAAVKVALHELGALIPLLRREYTATARVVVHADAPPAGFPSAALQGLEVQWRPPLRDDERLQQLAQSSAPLALLDASSKTAAQARTRRLWRAAAALAGLLLVAYPALLAWQHARLTEAERALGQRNDAVFRAAFPAIRRVVNPRVQADQAIAGVRAQTHAVPRFLDLVAQVDRVRAAGFPAGTRVVQASYSGGALELGIEVAGMDAVENVRSALKDSGLQAETLAAEAAAGKVVARLRVQAGS